MSKTRTFTFSMMVLVMMLGMLFATNAFADVIFSQLSKYNSANHYDVPDKEHPNRTGAVKAGTSDLPILYIELTSGTLTRLDVYYNGTDIADVGDFVKLVEDVQPNGEFDGSDRLVKKVSFTGLEAIFAALREDATAATKYYFVTLDVVSGAASNEVDLAVITIDGTDLGAYKYDSTTFVGTPSLDIPLDVPGKAQIDKTPPEFDVLLAGDPDNPLAGQDTPWYDKGTKVLMLSFKDKAGAITVPTPRLNVIDLDDDGKVIYRVDLSKLRIAYGGDDNTAAMLLSEQDGATLWWWSAGTGYIEIPAGKKLSDLGLTEDQVDEYRVWLGFSSKQDAHIQNNIIAEGKTPQIDILPGAVKDYAFGNSIAEAKNININTEEDNTPPEFVDPAKKPVTFDSTTNELVLTFNESIDAGDGADDVHLNKIKITNAVIEADSEKEPVPLTGPEGDATVTEDFVPTVTITLTNGQRDILMEDQPMLIIEDAAVHDVKGNDLDVGGSETLPVYVSPPLLSGVESRYDGDDPVAILDLKFTEVISAGMIDFSKITVTNEDGTDDSFTLTSDEIVGIINDAEGLGTIVRFAFDSEEDAQREHRDIISYWQANGDITELHIQLDEEAVTDERGNSNAAMADSEKIGWDKDSVGPSVLSGEYIHSDKVLKLRFNESLDLTSDDIDKLVASGKITLQGLDVADNPVGASITLSDDELKSGQSDGLWLQYTLTNTKRDAISAWDGDGAVKIQINVASDTAVKDLTGNKAGSSDAVIPDENWSEDTIRPDFAAAYYSSDLRRLRITFTDSITDAIVGKKPDLSKITVHTPGATGKNLGADAKYEVEEDALIISNLNDDQHAAIADKTNPLVSIDEAAVHDLAGNPVFPRPNKIIVYDDEGPTVISGSYTINLDADNNNRPKSGTLILTFDAPVDVSTTDLTKITLKAGTSVVSLEGETRKTDTDGTELKIEITIPDPADPATDDKVYKISGWGRDYPSLFVELAAGAIKDLAGNENALISHALEEWNQDEVEPTLNAGASRYIHDAGEAEAHRTWLILQFYEQMDTRDSVDYINAANIKIANQATGGDSIALTQEEIAPQDFRSDIVFYINEEHRDTISKWGSPLDKNKDKLYVRLIADAVTDRAGNGNVTMSTRAEIGTWVEDKVAPEYDSSAYDANTKKLTITFKEWVDTKSDGDLVIESKLNIMRKDGTTLVTNLDGATTDKSDKTKTVTITLTPEQDMKVKGAPSDKFPLKLDIGEDAVVDIANNGVADTQDKDITYTYGSDTTPPDLKRKDGKAESWYYHAKNDAVGAAQGTLRLNFNESIDRNPYTDIDAVKITLLSAASGGESFPLTQGEIRRLQPGDIVEPVAVNQIDFVLSSEHWNIVAGWSKVYVQIAAGAVKDTYTANSIGDIGPIELYYTFLDTKKPDIILPSTPIAEKAVGEDLTITATVNDDIAVRTVKLWYQVGGTVPTFLIMSRTSGDEKSGTYEATIPRTAVTNNGLSYYVWADDHAGNAYVKRMYKGEVKDDKKVETNINVKVTGSSVTLPAGTLPVLDFTAVPSRYRMISVPINKSVPSATLFEPFGTAGTDWLAWKFTGAAEANGYESGHSSGFTLNPGDAAWIGTVNPDADLIVEGDTKDVVGNAEITLHDGWNQIGIPFNFSRNWDDDTIGDSDAGVSRTIYWFTGESSNYSFASTDPDIPNQDVFATSWQGSGIPDNELVWNGWPGSLDPWGGYWVFSNGEGTKLRINPTVPGKGVLPTTPAAPSVEMPYNWSVKLIAEAGGVSGASKFAGIVADAVDGIDRYDVMDLPLLPGQAVQLSFITEAGDYLQDMRAPSDEMFWQFKVNSANMLPVTIRFDASAVPSEYRTVMLIDTATEASIDLRKATSYAYKPSEKIRNFKLIISKAHPEAYIIPKRSALLQNYPNPFNPETWVPYKLSKAGDVTIKIYNVAGQLVRTLELGYREAGSYTVRERAAYWDGKNISGERVASGMYFYYIQAGSFHATKKMVILK